MVGHLDNRPAHQGRLIHSEGGRFPFRLRSAC
jgi:hypothetical protein